MCLINWTSSSGCEAKCSRRTDSTKMVDTKLNPRGVTVSLEFLSAFKRDFFFYYLSDYQLSRPMFLLPQEPFSGCSREKAWQLMKTRQLSSWWLPKPPARPPALIVGESRVTVIWESDDGQLSTRMSLQDHLVVLVLSKRTKSLLLRWQVPLQLCGKNKARILGVKLKFYFCSFKYNKTKPQKP